MGTQLAQPDLDLLAYAEVQGLDEVAAQVNIIRRGAEAFDRIPQHGVIVLGLFHDSGDDYFMALCQKLLSQLKNQLGLGEGGRVPDREAFRHLLKIVQGAFPQFIDVNLFRNGSGGFLRPGRDCRSAGRIPCVFLRSGSRMFLRNPFRCGKGLGGSRLRILSGGEGLVVEFFSHEKNVGRVFGFAGGAGPAVLRSRGRNRPRPLFP